MREFYLQKIQNLLSFGLAFYTLITLVYHNYFGSNTNHPHSHAQYGNNVMDYPFMILTIFFIVDFPFASNIIKLHHIFGFCLTIFKLAHVLKFEDVDILIIAVYKTEISTVFYVIKLWLDDVNHVSIQTVKKLNEIAFLVTFFKYRIWDYSHEIVFNKQLHELMDTYIQGRLPHFALLYVGLYGFYILNMYWFAIMVKIAVKMMIAERSKPLLLQISHMVTSYTQFINVGIVIYVYCARPNESFIFDVVGCSILSVASYTYHNNQYMNIVLNKNEALTSPDSLIPFLNDQIAIHIRCLLCSFTAMYNSQTPLLLLIPTILHVGSITETVRYIWNLKIKNVEIPNNVKDATYKEFIQRVNFLQIFPVILDLIFVMTCSSIYMNRISLLFASVFCLVILLIEPFYELNHIAFHMGLIAQSYWLAKCNLR